MKPETFAALILVLLLIAAGGWYLYNNMATLAPEKPTQPQQIEKPQAEPQRLPVPPRNPVPPPRQTPITTETEPPIPAFPETLSESDAFLNLRLPQLVANQKLLALLQLDHFIEKLVLFIDQLPGKEIPRRYLPFKPPQPGFLASGGLAAARISPRNEARYALHVKLVEAIPAQELVQLYRGLYPLFQRAYTEIEPKGYFNDRLIQVIDHLLQTPEIEGQIPLEKHINRYLYADPDLEARSAGQKILLRMGLENNRRVKAVLSKVREELIRPDY